MANLILARTRSCDAISGPSRNLVVSFLYLGIVTLKFDMTTHATKVDSAIVADWVQIAEAYKRRPQDVAPPETPEAIHAMVELIATVYGDALKELAER